MGQDRNRILDLLAAGKITAEEAGRLLDAMESSAAADSNERATQTALAAGSKDRSGIAKFLFVKVVSTKGENVNIKVPLGVLRAGLKLTTLIPKPAGDQINKAMTDKGMAFDLNDLKPEDLEELIDSLAEMEIEVDADNGDTVRVYAA
jgi:hypothetical protein